MVAVWVGVNGKVGASGCMHGGLERAMLAGGKWWGWPRSSASRRSVYCDGLGPGTHRHGAASLVLSRRAESSPTVGRLLDRLEVEEGPQSATFTPAFYKLPTDTFCVRANIVWDQSGTDWHSFACSGSNWLLHSFAPAG